MAGLTGRAEFTVREWCRLGRISAEKETHGRKREWRVSHEELQRILNHGPMPLLPRPTLASALKIPSSIVLHWTTRPFSSIVVSPLMASLENRTGYFNVVFRFGGKKFTRSLSTDDPLEADRLRANLEQTIRDVKSGRIVLPPDADIPTFLLSDGKLAHPHIDQSDGVSDARISLRDLFESFFASLPDDSLEESTIAQMQTHRNNLLHILGDSVFTDQVDLNTLDSYTRARRKAKIVEATVMSGEILPIGAAVDNTLGQFQPAMPNIGPGSSSNEPLNDRDVAIRSRKPPNLVGLVLLCVVAELVAISVLS